MSFTGLWLEKYEIHDSTCKQWKITMAFTSNGVFFTERENENRSFVVCKKQIILRMKRGLKENDERKKKRRNISYKWNGRQEKSWGNFRRFLSANFRLRLQLDLFLLFRKLLNRMIPKFLITILFRMSINWRWLVSKIANLARDESRQLRAADTHTRTLKYYVWPICLVQRAAPRFETVSRVWSVRLSVSSVSPRRLPLLAGVCVSVPNEKRYVSHRQLTWVNYKRTSGLCSARMNLLAR